MSSQQSHSWPYFLAVEAELKECSRYVEFHRNNFSCYSNEFAKIILLAAAEVDSLLLAACKVLDKKALGERPNLGTFRKILNDKHPAFVTRRVLLAAHQLDLEPWEGWSPERGPSWWSKSYNKLKHARHEHFSEANLGNALNAVGAHFLSVLLHHEVVTNQQFQMSFSAQSALFDTLREPDGITGASITVTYGPVGGQ